MTSEHEHPHEETETEEVPAEEVETEPAPAPAPAPPAGGGDRIDRIENVVNGLVDIVAGLAPKDDRPTKLPWTHRFGRDDS